MEFKALVGPSYQMFSPKAEVQLARNVFRERVETDQGVNAFVLNKAPGLSVNAGIPIIDAGPVRGMMELNGFLFAAVNGQLASGDSPGALAAVGPISNDGLPVQMAASPTALVFISNKILYRLSGALTTPATPFTPIGVVFLKNYFVALAESMVGANTQFYWSTDDGITWDAGNIQSAEAQANNIVAIQAINELLCLIGNRYAQWFSVGSNANAPFVPIDSGVMRVGTAAAATVARLGQSLIWLEQGEQGGDGVILTNGFQAIQIGNGYVNNRIRAFRSQSGIDDAVGMSYSFNNNEFYRLVFPAADWSFDFNKTVWEKTGVPEWTDAVWWDWRNGQYHRHRANSMVSAFGMNLAGDWENGNIYELTPDCFHDFGFPMRWQRRTPHIVQENKQISIARLDLGIQTGVGLTTPLQLNNYSLDPVTFATALAALVPGTISAAQAAILTQIYDFQAYDTSVLLPSVEVTSALGFYEWGRDPQIALRYSRDGGKSFSSELKRSLGKAGEDKQVYWNRLALPRDAVYDLYGDDPCQLAITTGYLEAEALLS